MSGWSSLIPQSGLVHAWPFDTANTTTGTATDTVGSSNATQTSVTLNGSGPNALLNNAGVFNGTSSHGDTTAANIPTAALSLIHWINCGTVAGGERLMANDHTDIDNKGLQLLVDTGGASPTYRLDIGNGTTFNSLTSVAAAAGAWHMITFTWDGTTILSYTDASLNGSSNTFTGPISTPTNNLSFGFNPASSGDFWPGKLAGVAIYSRAISGTEVTTIFNLTGGFVPYNPWPQAAPVLAQ